MHPYCLEYASSPGECVAPPRKRALDLLVVVVKVTPTMPFLVQYLSRTDTNKAPGRRLRFSIRTLLRDHGARAAAFFSKARDACSKLQPADTAEWDTMGA